MREPGGMTCCVDSPLFPRFSTLNGAMPGPSEQCDLGGNCPFNDSPVMDNRASPAQTPPRPLPSS